MEGAPLSRVLQVRSQLQELAGRVVADRRGVTAVITGLALTTLIGFCGLAVDVVMWEVNQRNLQGAADQAALAAATAFQNAGETGALGDSTTAQNAAYATAIRSGYPAASITVAAYNNATTCTGDGCLQVTITQQQPQYFTGVFFSGITTSASAVGSIAVAGAGGGACVMALDPSGSGVITASGTPTLSLHGCNLQNNSPNTNATIVNGGAVIEGCSATNACGSKAFLAQPDVPSGSIDVPVVTNAAPAPDPYANVTPPTVAASCQPLPSPPTNVASGTYCGGNNFQNLNITFASGAVIVVTGGLDLHSGSTTLTGTGVTLYVVSDGTNAQKSTINATTTVNITAPSSGTYAGLALWFSGSSPVKYDGSNSSSFKGAIYAPTATEDYGGNAASASTCTRLVAKEISLHGTSAVSLDNTGCPAVAGPVLTASGVTGSTTNTGQPILVQ
jgi:Flp pilus assembly protein TadG